MTEQTTTPIDVETSSNDTASTEAIATNPSAWAVTKYIILGLLLWSATIFSVGFIGGFIIGYSRASSKTVWDIGSVVWLTVVIPAFAGQLSIAWFALMTRDRKSLLSRLKASRYGRIRHPAFLISICLAMAVYIMIWGLYNPFRGANTNPAWARISLWHSIAFGSLFMLAAVCEELFFRGALWSKIGARWNEWIAGGLTSLLWLGAHFPEGGLSRVLILTPLAIALPLVRARCQTLAAPILVHLLNNSIALVIVWRSLAASN